jgi:formylglycine-generating enzyme required for sulfatase activity
MEWMWAAMGADTASPGQVNRTGYKKTFAGSTGSNSIGDYAWYADNSGGKTHPVGTKRANELGLYDMSGNVWEWCWDWYGDWPSGAKIIFTGAASGEDRVRRGGGWGFDASYCAVSVRFGSRPYFRFKLYGFGLCAPEFYAGAAAPA